MLPGTKETRLGRIVAVSPLSGRSIASVSIDTGATAVVVGDILLIGGQTHRVAGLSPVLGADRLDVLLDVAPEDVEEGAEVLHVSSKASVSEGAR